MLPAVLLRCENQPVVTSPIQHIVLNRQTSRASGGLINAMRIITGERVNPNCRPSSRAAPPSSATAPAPPASALESRRAHERKRLPIGRPPRTAISIHRRHNVANAFFPHVVQ